MKTNPTELRKIGHWLVRGDTGSSSLAMCGVSLGADIQEPRHPLDPADFGRCYEFMLICINQPKRKELIAEMAKKSKEWKIIRENWKILEELWLEEKNEALAPKLYKKMKEIGL